MKKTTRKLLSLAMASAMAASLLTGGGANETTAAAGTEKTEAGKTETEAGSTEAAAEGTADADYSQDVITYGMTQAWDTINPYGSSSGSIYQNLVCDKLYDRLAFIEEAGTDVTPRGAKSWESADDGKAAVFHLDENAKWHDGEPVTASDWVFTAQLITNPKFDYGLRSEFNTWAGTDDTGTEESEKSVQVEAVDDYTLKINFKSVIPVEDWLILHNKYFYVLPEHLLKDMAPEEIKTSDFWKAPVGSGPCTFISELSGSELQLGSFADYHMGAPKFGKLVLKVIAATNTITSIAAGEMDGFFQAPTVDDALAAKDMGLNVEQSAEPTTVAVFLINNQNVSDKKVRQAMSYAIDKQMLIDQSLQGQGVPATTCIIPGSQYEFGTKWERNVDKAKELLAEAGYGDGLDLKMYVSGDVRNRTAQVVQAQLAQIGVNVDINVYEWGAFQDAINAGEHELLILGWTNTTCDPEYSVTPLFHSKNCGMNGNRAYLRDEKVDEMIDAASMETDREKRLQTYRDLQVRLNELCPWVPLYYKSNMVGRRADLKGFQFNKNTALHYLGDCYFEK